MPVTPIVDDPKLAVTDGGGVFAILGKCFVAGYITGYFFKVCFEIVASSRSRPA